MEGFCLRMGKIETSCAVILQVISSALFLLNGIDRGRDREMLVALFPVNDLLRNDVSLLKTVKCTNATKIQNFALFWCQGHDILLYMGILSSAYFF